MERNQIWDKKLMIDVKSKIFIAGHNGMVGSALYRLFTVKGYENLIIIDHNSLASLSCMHTVEHIGLVRYGDELDPDGDLKAMKELSRVLAENGNLLFVVPIGKPKICFNAHRIYSYEQRINVFSSLYLEEFMLIPDNAQTQGIIYDDAREISKDQNYACGCFWFKKNSN